MWLPKYEANTKSFSLLLRKRLIYLYSLADAIARSVLKGLSYLFEQGGFAF